MKLCVQMAVYNEELFVRTAIESVLAEPTCCEVEITVVDDGSTDQTAAIVSEIVARHANVRLIQTSNQGVAAARNVLLDALPNDCDLVTFLDGDDVFASGHLARECRRFASNAELEMSYHSVCLVESDEQDLAANATSSSPIIRGIHLCTAIVKYSTMCQVGEFDTTYVQAEDADFIFRLLESSPTLHVGDEIAVYYRQHAGNMTKTRDTMRRFVMRAMVSHARRVRDLPGAPSLEGVFSPGFFDQTDQS